MADRLDEEIARIRALGVVVTFLQLSPALALRKRVAEVFVVPDAHERVMFPTKAVPFESLLRVELQVPRPIGSAVEWLCEREAGWRGILRLDRVASRVVTVQPQTIEPTWLLSWPGVYVAADMKRAIAVGVDYEVVFCDAVLRPQPYR